MAKDFIVAIEIGSSKITGIAGKTAMAVFLFWPCLKKHPHRV